MSPRGHDRQYQGDLIPVGSRVACCESTWWGNSPPKLGVVASAEKMPGTSRRARRFDMQLPIYGIVLDDGRQIVHAGNTLIYPLPSD